MIAKSCCALLAVAACALAQSPGWKMTWHDEFDGATLAASKWVYVVGGNGFGNDELEYYTDRPQNLYVRDGMLTIEAIKEDYPAANGKQRNFTSARIHTKGKFAQKYGRFEARIKVPFGQGMWPAFWMMGDVRADWPANGEIDIMENIGREPSKVHGTIHGPGYSGDSAIGAPFSLPAGQKFCDDFHVYAVEWEPNAIRWYVDGKQYHSVTPASLPAGAKWVYDHPFFIILNVAVGGGWPGNPDASTTFPQRMLVDYVRVYSKNP
jgi:beta-glucanase (GH16 family)